MLIATTPLRTSWQYTARHAGGCPGGLFRRPPPRHQTATGPAAHPGRSRAIRDVGTSRPLARTASPPTS